MAKKKSNKKKPPKGKLDAAFHEVFTNTPSTVKKQSPEKMRKQKIAIAFSKARKGK